jgi:hypothetical protein
VLVLDEADGLASLVVFEVAPGIFDAPVGSKPRESSNARFSAMVL